MGIFNLKLAHSFETHVREVGYENTHCVQSVDSLSNYECGIYDNDYQTSRIIRFLEEHNLLKYTIIIGVADHGTDYKKRRGRLFNYYEEVLHVPFFMYIPKKYQDDLDLEYANWRDNVNSVTKSTDILPTVLQILGLDKKAPFKSYLDQLDGQSVFRKISKGRIIEALNTNSLRRRWSEDGFVLIKDAKDQYKYIYDLSDEFLFNLSKDPEELTNLLPTSDPLTTQVHNEFLEYIKSKQRLFKIYSSDH